MPWTTPNSVSAGDLVSAANHNTYIRDNLNYLLSLRPILWVNYVGGAHKTYTSTSWAAVDTTNLRATATLSGTRAFVVASFRWQHSDTASGSGSELGGDAYFDIACDGTRAGDSTYGLYRGKQSNNGSVIHSATILARFTGLAVGSRNFDLYWKTSGATLTLMNNNYPITMFGFEF